MKLWVQKLAQAELNTRFLVDEGAQYVLLFPFRALRHYTMSVG